MAPSGARWHQAQERQNARNERRARSSDALQRRLVDEWSPAWLRSHSEPSRDWGRVDVPDSPPGGTPFTTCSTRHSTRVWACAWKRWSTTSATSRSTRRCAGVAPPWQGRTAELPADPAQRRRRVAIEAGPEPALVLDVHADQLFSQDARPVQTSADPRRGPKLVRRFPALVIEHDRQPLPSPEAGTTPSAARAQHAR
jgi:hypothetical protein